MSSKIIRNCVRREDFYSAFVGEIERNYDWVKTETIDDTYEVGCRYYFTENEYISIVYMDRNYTSLCIRIGNESDKEACWQNINASYIAYTIVITGGSIAIAIDSSMNDGNLITNDFRIMITDVNGTKVGIYNDYQWFNGGCKSNTEGNNQIRRIQSAYEWTQLIPFGLPELAGVSPDVFVIRYSPFAQSKIEIDGTKYMLGDYYAIRLED